MKYLNYIMILTATLIITNCSDEEKIVKVEEQSVEVEEQNVKVEEQNVEVTDETPKQEGKVTLELNKAYLLKKGDVVVKTKENTIVEIEVNQTTNQSTIMLVEGGAVFE